MYEIRCRLSGATPTLIQKLSQIEVSQHLKKDRPSKRVNQKITKERSIWW